MVVLLFSYATNSFNKYLAFNLYEYSNNYKNVQN